MGKQKQSTVEDIEAHELSWGNCSPLYKLFKGKKWDKDNLSCKKKKKNWEGRENIEILWRMMEVNISWEYFFNNFLEVIKQWNSLLSSFSCLG